MEKRMFFIGDLYQSFSFVEALCYDINNFKPWRIDADSLHDCYY